MITFFFIIISQYYYCYERDKSLTGQPIGGLIADEKPLGCCLNEFKNVVGPQ